MRISIRTRRSRSAQLLELEYTGSVARLLEYFFTGKWLSAVMGLGVGLGVSLVVLGRPDVLQATVPTSQQVTGWVGAQQVVFDMSEHYPVSTGELTLGKMTRSTHFVHDQRFGSLVDAQAAVIADLGTRSFLTDFEQQQPRILGRKLRILGQNNGWYSFVITRRVSIPARQLSDFVQQNPNSVLLYYSSSPLRTQLEVFVAVRE